MVKHVGEEAWVLDKISLERSRHFIIPMQAKVGLVFSTSMQEYVISKTSSPSAFDANKTALNNYFSEVNILSEGEGVPNNIDFLIKTDLIYLDKESRMQLITLASTEKDQTPNELMEDLSHSYFNNPSSNNKDETSADSSKKIWVEKKRKLPIKAVIKFNLYEARSNRLIDVGIVKSRSGIFTKDAVKKLFNQSVTAYANNITEPY
jgi:hypothetical protein